MTPASMGPVIFDLDGVLVDSEPHWQYAYAEVVNRYSDAHGWGGPKVTATSLREHEGGRATETLAAVFEAIGHPEVAADRTTIRRLSRQAVALASADFRERGEPIEASVLVAKALARQGHRLAVASSSSLSFINLVLRTRRARRSDRSPPVGIVAVGGQAESRVYELALEKLGADAGECVAIEDSARGVLAARTATRAVHRPPSRRRNVGRRSSTNASSSRGASCEDVEAALAARDAP